MQLPAPFAPPSSTVDIAITTARVPLQPGRPITDADDDFAYETLADGSVFVRWYDRFEFHVAQDGSSIRAYRHDDSPDEALYAYLLGQGLSVALLQQGLEGLHAAAFSTNSEAIAMLGDSGFGKSTLAAHAVRAGARLLTDDLLVFDGRAVLPGPARIKLEPEMARTTLGAREGTPMYDERSKWIYALNEEEYSTEAVELSRIYVLEPHADEIAAERLDHSDAMKALLSATFNPLEQSAARIASHMRYHAALARSVPVFRLHVPRRCADIEKVLEAM